MLKGLPSFLALTLALVVQVVKAETLWAVHVTNFSGRMPHPEIGYKSLKYPITVVSGPDSRKFYYAQYGYFSKSGTEGGSWYTGIQPQGNNVAIAVFSVFGKGVTKRARWCTGDADGGKGATCLRKIPFRFGVRYEFTARLAGQSADGNIWHGYVTNTATQKTWKTGSWVTPADWGYLTGNSIGFIEDYSGISSCQKIEPTIAVFGVGVGILSDGRRDKGHLNKAYAVGACKNKVPFNSVSSSVLTVHQESGSE